VKFNQSFTAAKTIKQKKEVEDNTGIGKNEYCDILSTEDCFVDEDTDIGDNIILGYN